MRELAKCMMAFTLVACGGSSPPPVEEPTPPPSGGLTPAVDCPQEAGGDAPDGIDGAIALAVGTHPGCFAVGDKKDTYALQSPEDEFTLYKISYEGHANAQGCFEMWDAEKKQATWTDRCAAGAGATKSAWALVAPNSRWFLQVHDLSGNAGSEARAYKLALETTAVKDDDEPNGKPEEAKPVAFGKAKPSYFFEALNGPQPEVDYFEFDLSSKGTLTVAIEDVDPAVQFAVKITDGTGKVVIEKGAANAGASHSVQTKIGTGNFRIELRNVAGAGTPPVGTGEPPGYATKPYKLTVTRK